MEKITAQTGPLAFIGGGAMTEAIIKGILGAGLADPGEIFVGEPSAARCEYLQKTYGIKASGDNKAVVKDAGLIILAVKPQVVDAAITAELAAAMPPQATVLSIMGSVDLAASGSAGTCGHQSDAQYTAGSRCGDDGDCA